MVVPVNNALKDLLQNFSQSTLKRIGTEISDEIRQENMCSNGCSLDTIAQINYIACDQEELSNCHWCCQEEVVSYSEPI